MRWALALVVICACGDEDVSGRDGSVVSDAPPDVPAWTNPGFVLPTAPLAAYTESGGDFVPAVLDLSCLGTASTDPATQYPIALTVRVLDFQSGTAVTGAQVTAFASVNTSAVIAMATTDAQGNAMLTIPVGTKRIGFRIAGTSVRETFVFDILLQPATTQQTIMLESVSNTTAQTLPALIGKSSAPGTAISIGQVRDCSGHTLANFSATLSAVPAMIAHWPQADTYYFNAPVGLPVSHATAVQSGADGRFMVTDLLPGAQAWIQVWGYRDAAALSSGSKLLIAQLAVPVAADSSMTTTHAPLATN